MKGAYPFSFVFLLSGTILPSQHGTSCMGEGNFSYSNYVTLFMKIYYIISIYHYKNV